MSTFIQGELTFSLFANDKGDNHKRPDLTGTAMINGVEYKLSAWKAEAKSGTKYLNGKMTRVAVQEKPIPRQSAEDMLDDVIKY